MLAILNFLNAHILPIFQLILMILASKIMVHRPFSDKIYLSLGLLSPLRHKLQYPRSVSPSVRPPPVSENAKLVYFDIILHTYAC